MKTKRKITPLSNGQIRVKVFVGNKVYVGYGWHISEAMKKLKEAEK